jgi:2-keto-3-deoxy-galactonokinase
MGTSIFFYSLEKDRCATLFINMIVKGIITSKIGWEASYYLTNAQPAGTRDIREM